MTDASRLADPERSLALSYAPGDRRAALAALWALDERMGAIVASTSEPTIGEMRLLWWREALESLPGGAAGEPLLEEVGEALLPLGIGGAEIGALAQGWRALLGEPFGPSERARFAGERGGRLFALSARALGGEASDGIASAGEGWALVDLARRSRGGDEAALAEARDRLARAPGRWPVRLRGLGALAALARRDAARGAPLARQGSPSRVARMAWHRLTGK